MTGNIEIDIVDSTEIFITKDKLLEGLRSIDKPFKQAQYCCVLVKNEYYSGIEFIINRRENFRDKADYYEKAYDENLVLKSCDKISITGALFATNLTSLVAKIEELC